MNKPIFIKNGKINFSLALAPIGSRVQTKYALEALFVKDGFLLVCNENSFILKDLLDDVNALYKINRKLYGIHVILDKDEPLVYQILTHTDIDSKKIFGIRNKVEMQHIKDCKIFSNQADYIELTQVYLAAVKISESANQALELIDSILVGVDKDSYVEYSLIELKLEYDRIKKEKKY